MVGLDTPLSKEQNIHDKVRGRGSPHAKKQEGGTCWCVGVIYINLGQ